MNDIILQEIIDEQLKKYLEAKKQLLKAKTILNKLNYEPEDKTTGQKIIIKNEM